MYGQTLHWTQDITHHDDYSLQDVKIKSVSLCLPLTVMEMAQVEIEDFDEPIPSAGPVPQYFPGDIIN